MTTLTLDIAQASLPDEMEVAPPREATLGDLIARAWTTLGVTQSADCPLCGGDLAPRFGAGPEPVGAACRSCGTELS